MKKQYALLALAALLTAGIVVSGVPVPAYAEVAALAAETDETIVSTYQHESALIAAPTVVVDAVDEGTFNAVVEGEKKPSNVILHVNGDGYVIGEDGSKIETLADTFVALDHKVIPILYVNDEAGANAVSEYFDNTQTILDIAVMSNDPALVALAQKDHTFVRGILEVDGTQDREEMVVSAQRGEAMTIVVPQTFATVANVSYLQGMFKTVWVRTDSDSAVNISDAVFSGAYGIIVKNAEAAYNFYDIVTEPTYARTPFIAAHRGDVQNCNENSLSGIASAAQNGATHVELDFHVTADKRLVAMHDTTLTNTTNGTGSVASMTLAQIQKYQIDNHATAEPEMIPTLEDCVTAILESGNDDMIFILELKCSGTEIVQLVYNTLTENSDLTPIFDRMVVITFYADQLAEMQKVMPDVPTAYLATATQATFKTVLNWMGQYNTGIDTSNGNITPQFQAMLRDRGIIDWSYTYSTYNDALNAQKKGVIGITTNQPAAYGNEVRSVYAEGFKTTETVDLGFEVDVKVNYYHTSYDSLTETVKGTVAAYEENFFAYKAIVRAQLGDYTYYTQSITIEKANAPIIVGAGVGAGALIALILLVAIAKAGKKKKAAQASKTKAGKNSKKSNKKKGK